MATGALATGTDSCGYGERSVSNRAPLADEPLADEPLAKVETKVETKAQVEAPKPSFRPTATLESAGETCEIVVASPDEKQLVYTDATGAQIGFVDVSDAAQPNLQGILNVGGEPTSVAFSRDGAFVLAVVYGAPHAQMQRG